MRADLRSLTFLAILISFIACGETAAVGGIPCTTSADCANPCQTGVYCDDLLGYCRWSGVKPDGTACTSDGTNTTYDFCSGGQCTHVVDCSTQPGDYCSGPPHVPCHRTQCLPMDMAPGSPANFTGWGCVSSLAPDGTVAFFDPGTEPPSVCNNTWVCQGGSVVPSGGYSYQDNQECLVNQDPTAGVSECDGVFYDRCRPNAFVTNCFDPQETLRSVTPYTTTKGYCYAMVTASMLGGTIPSNKKPGWIELPSPQFSTRMPDGAAPGGPRTAESVSVMTHTLLGSTGASPADYDLPVVVLEGFDPDNKHGWNNSGWNGLLFPAIYGPNGLAYDGYDIVFVGQSDGSQSVREYAQGAARAIYEASKGFPTGPGASRYPYNGKVFVFGISEGGLVAKMVLSAWEACYDTAFSSSAARCPSWFPQELKAIDPVSIVSGALAGDSPIEGAHVPHSFQSFLRKAALDCIQLTYVSGDLLKIFSDPIEAAFGGLSNVRVPVTYSRQPFGDKLAAIGITSSALLDVTPAREMLVRWVDGSNANFDANTTTPRTALGTSVAPIYAEANRYGIGFPGQSYGHGYPQRITMYALSEGAWRTNGQSRSVTNCLGWNDPIGCSGPLGEAFITSPPTHMSWLDPSGSACLDQHIMFLDPIDIGEGSAIASFPRDMAYKMVQRNHGLPGIATSEGDVIWQGLNGDGLCNAQESHLNSVDCPRGPISGGQALYIELDKANMGLRFNWMRPWNYQPTASALGCAGFDANSDRLPDSITPVSTEAECNQIIQNRGGYGFFDAFWQEKALAHDSLVYEYKQMPKSYAFLRSVLDEFMKGDGDGYLDRCADLSGLPAETEANYPTLAAQKWGKGKWKACDECPGDAASHTHAGCASATRSSAGWRRTARPGFPTSCVNATATLSRPYLCPKGDTPQVVDVTVLDDNGQPMPGVPRTQIQAAGTCRLLPAGGVGTCGPLDANNAPTTWASQIPADADTDAQGKTTITLGGAIGDCSDFQIVVRGKRIATLGYRNVDFLPRTGVDAQSGSIGVSEFNALTNTVGRTDRDWEDFDCSGVISSIDVNVGSAHGGHKCTP